MRATDEIEPGIISENLIHCPLTFFIDDMKLPLSCFGETQSFSGSLNLQNKPY